jgi:hypothetical protein
MQVPPVCASTGGIATNAITCKVIADKVLRALREMGRKNFIRSSS